MKRPPFPACLLIMLVMPIMPLASACAAADGGMASPSTTTDATTTDGSTGALPETGSSGGSSGVGSSTGGSFVSSPDAGANNECDPRAQDCPDGEKCTAWASTGGTWDANKCVPVSGAGITGDSCLVRGVGSGLDDCAEGYMCFYVTERGTGTCVSFCDLGDNCPNGETCAIQNDGALPVCETACDPLLQNCPDGMGCYAVDGANGVVICMEDASQNAGQDDDPCQGFDNVCDPGLACMVGTAGCTGTSCCTPWCDLSQPNACVGAGEDCLPHFETPTPGYESLGVCVIP